MQPTIIQDSIETKLHCARQRATEIMQYPETQLFLYDLLLMKLVDDGDLKNVSDLSLYNRGIG